MSEVMIQADGLVKIYKSKQTEVLALQGLDLTVEKGELTALIYIVEYDWRIRSSECRFTSGGWKESVYHGGTGTGVL